MTSSATTPPAQAWSPPRCPPRTGTPILDAVKEDPSLEIVIDIERRLVEAPAAGISAPFALDDDARDRLLRGLDDIGVTEQHAQAIASYEARRAGWLPEVTG